MFDGFIKTFDSTDKEAVRFKLRQKGMSDNMVECIKKIHNSTKVCVKLGGNKVTFC
jgi:hypothetical protein